MESEDPWTTEQTKLVVGMFVRAVFGAFRDVMLSILCARVVKSFFFIQINNICRLYFFVPARRSKQSWIDCHRLVQLGSSMACT